METQAVLKVLADNTRFKIVKMLLHKNHCVRALSRKLNISESAVSQHIKVLKESNLLIGEKSGYYMHYNVNRNILHQLSKDIEDLANIQRVSGTSMKCERRHIHMDIKE